MAMSIKVLFIGQDPFETTAIWENLMTYAQSNPYQSAEVSFNCCWIC